jgi:hypothetical protein
VTSEPINGTYGDIGLEANGVIIFSDAGRLATVPAAGGKVRHLYPDSLKIPPQVMPRFLPDGKHFVFATGYRSSTRGIWIGSIDGERPRQILPQFSRVAVTDGKIYFVKDGTLVSQPFDEGKGEVRGEPEAVAPRVGQDALTGGAPFDISPGGTLVYGRSVAARTKILAWYERTGKRESIVAPPVESAEMNLSPDGRWIAFDLFSSAGPDVWVLNTQTGIRSRVTADSSSNSPVWMPDSREIVYQRRQLAVPYLRRHVLGTTIDTALTNPAVPNLNVDDVSPDGATVLAHFAGQLYTVAVASGVATPALKRLAVVQGRFSPDGRWISFNSRETGTHEIYVAKYPKLDRILRVSSAGGMQARWRADGRELLYLALDGKVMSVAVSAQGDDPFAAPVQLFASPIREPLPNFDSWSVTRDGKRFLFLVPAEGPEGLRAPLTVIRNWSGSVAGSAH